MDSDQRKHRLESILNKAVSDSIETKSAQNSRKGVHIDADGKVEYIQTGDHCVVDRRRTIVIHQSRRSAGRIDPSRQEQIRAATQRIKKRKIEMSETPKNEIDFIHANLFDLVDTLTNVSSFVKALGALGQNCVGDGGSAELKVIFDDIQDKIDSAAEVLEVNVKGLQMTTLE